MRKKRNRELELCLQNYERESIKKQIQNVELRQKIQEMKTLFEAKIQKFAMPIEVAQLINDPEIMKELENVANIQRENKILKKSNK